MLLGKRPRPPIKRTTSMTGITVDLNIADPTDQPSDEPYNSQNPMHAIAAEVAPATINSAYNYDHRFLAMVSPRNHRPPPENDFVETAHFLRSCGLCQRRLAPGRDIYMYRGDTAFCSLECREQQIKQDERKEKFNAVASKNEENRSSSASKASNKSETVAAA